MANPQPSNDPAEVSALEAILDSARCGSIRVQLTAAYNRDFQRFKDPEGRKNRLAWLGEAPTLARAPGLFRLDVSKFGGPDVLAATDDIELDQAIRAIILPGDATGLRGGPHRAAKLYSDIDHLVAHRRSGADAFLTLDVKTILNRRDKLRPLGIVACKPTEAISLLPALEQ